MLVPVSERSVFTSSKAWTFAGVLGAGRLSQSHLNGKLVLEPTPNLFEKYYCSRNGVHLPQKNIGENTKKMSFTSTLVKILTCIPKMMGLGKVSGFKYGHLWYAKFLT